MSAVKDFNYGIDETATLTITCGVLVQGDDAAAYKTAMDEARAKLVARDKALSVSFESTQHFDLTAAAATALRSRASIVSEEAVRNRVTILRWKYTAKLPAQVFRGDTSQGGFLDGQIALQTDFSRRPVYNFTGEYRSESGGSAKSARELKEDATVGIRKRIEDWLDANALLSVPSGDKSDWFKITVFADQGDWTGESAYEGAILTFNAVARMSIIPTKADHTGLAANYTVDALAIRGQRVRQWSASGLSRPYIFSVSMAVTIDVTQDDYETIDAVYTDDLKAFLQNHIDIVVGSATLGAISSGGAADAGWVLIDEGHPYMTDTNKIEVNWTCQRFTEFGWLSLVAAASYDEDFREKYIKDADGQDDTFKVQTRGRMLQAVERYTGTYFSRSRLTRDQLEALVPLAGGSWRIKKRVVPQVQYTKVETFGGGSGWIHDIVLERPYIYIKSRGRTSVAPTRGASNEPGLGV